MKTLCAVVLVVVATHDAYAQQGRCARPSSLQAGSELVIAALLSPFEQEPADPERPQADLGGDIQRDLTGKLSLSTKQLGPGKALLILSSTIEDAVGFVIVAPERGDILLRVYSDLMKDVVVAAAPGTTPLADIAMMRDHLSFEDLKTTIPYDLSTTESLEVRVVKADSTVHPFGLRGKFMDEKVTIIVDKSSHNCYDVWLTCGTRENCAYARCCGFMAPCTIAGQMANAKSHARPVRRSEGRAR